MPQSTREITSDDIIPDAEFRLHRAERRASRLPIKRLRRVALGPDCTFYFESFDTMLFQVQEMLLVEGGGPAQISGELAAYNPLIPQGEELVATVMFEIENATRRAQFLAGLGSIERNFYLQTGDQRSLGTPEDDSARTREDGKTSAVHFLRFGMTKQQIATFQEPSAHVMIGCADPRYAHMAVLGPAVRIELARDFRP